MSDELKRLVELAERQEQREIARSRYWRNLRWVALVMIAVVIAFSVCMQVKLRQDAERQAEAWRHQTDIMLKEAEQRTKDARP
jgi:hypothetical protein